MYVTTINGVMRHTNRPIGDLTVIGMYKNSSTHVGFSFNVQGRVENKAPYVWYKILLDVAG